VHFTCRHVQGRLQGHRKEGKRRDSLRMMNFIYFTDTVAAALCPTLCTLVLITYNSLSFVIVILQYLCKC